MLRRCSPDPQVRQFLVKLAHALQQIEESPEEAKRMSRDLVMPFLEILQNLPEQVHEEVRGQALATLAARGCQPG